MEMLIPANFIALTGNLPGWAQISVSSGSSPCLDSNYLLKWALLFKNQSEKKMGIT